MFDVLVSVSQNEERNLRNNLKLITNQKEDKAAAEQLKVLEAQLRCFNMELLAREIRAQEIGREQGKVAVYSLIFFIYLFLSKQQIFPFFCMTGQLCRAADGRETRPAERNRQNDRRAADQVAAGRFLNGRRSVFRPRQRLRGWFARCMISLDIWIMWSVMIFLN